MKASVFIFSVNQTLLAREWKSNLQRGAATVLNYVSEKCSCSSSGVQNWHLMIMAIVIVVIILAMNFTGHPVVACRLNSFLYLQTRSYL